MKWVLEHQGIIGLGPSHPAQGRCLGSGSDTGMVLGIRLRFSLPAASAMC